MDHLHTSAPPSAGQGLNESKLGVVNGRVTTVGEWEGTIMVIGSDGSCESSGLCTGMFIHPEVVMTAGHCCGTGEIKAICGGKVRPGAKLAQSKAMVKDQSGNNDFCTILILF